MYSLLASVRGCWLVIGKIGSIPLKKHNFRYIPLKDQVIDIYHQKMQLYSYMYILLASVRLSVSFFSQHILGSYHFTLIRNNRGEQGVAPSSSSGRASPTREGLPGGPSPARGPPWRRSPPRVASPKAQAPRVASPAAAPPCASASTVAHPLREASQEARRALPGVRSPSCTQGPPEQTRYPHLSLLSPILS